MKLKIISDGTPMGTEVVDIETGERLENLKIIEWKCSVFGDNARATLTIDAVQVEIASPDHVRWHVVRTYDDEAENQR